MYLFSNLAVFMNMFKSWGGEGGSNPCQKNTDFVKAFSHKIDTRHGIEFTIHSKISKELHP